MQYGGDRDLGAAVAAQMHEVCDRLPVPVAHAALAGTASSVSLIEISSGLI
jgi:hypothetical protein